MLPQSSLPGCASAGIIILIIKFGGINDNSEGWCHVIMTPVFFLRIFVNVESSHQFP